MTAVSNQNKKIHPHKFTLWVAIGSIVMMFAGLTSAYIVKRSQSEWLEFSLPTTFVYSTIAIIISSVTIHLAVKAFKARLMKRYRILMLITVCLGILFTVLQTIGFTELYNKGIQLFGIGSNPSASFLGVITGLHIVHILGGVIALLVILFKAYFSTSKIYSSTSIEILSTYWHFVDILWIYLFVFFNWI